MRLQNRSLVIFTSLLVLVLIILLINQFALSSVYATDTSSGIGSLIKGLNDSKSVFSVGFKTYVAGKDSWSIPEKFTDENNNVIGQRLLTEINETYFCADEIGQGFTTNICVPFDNISYVSTP